MYAFLVKYLCLFVLSPMCGKTFKCKDLKGKNTAYCLCAYRKPGLFGFYLCLTKSFECDVYLRNANLLSNSRQNYYASVTFYTRQYRSGVQWLCAFNSLWYCQWSVQTAFLSPFALFHELDCLT